MVSWMQHRCGQGEANHKFFTKTLRLHQNNLCGVLLVPYGKLDTALMRAKRGQPQISAKTMRLLQNNSCGAVLVPYGKLDAASLRAGYEANPKQRLQIQLQREARRGQPDSLHEIPIYAHIRVHACYLGHGFF